MSDTIQFSQADSTNNRIHPPLLYSLTRAQFTRKLSTFAVGKKESTALWIPAAFSRPSRESSAVKEITAFVVDADSLKAGGLLSRVQELEAKGYSFIVHSSHGYTEAKPKARFIFFLDQPITIGTPWRWSQAIWPRLMGYLGFEDDSADRQCRNADRAYYLPVKRSAEAETFTHVFHGKDLPTRGILADILAKPVAEFDYTTPYVSEEDPGLEVEPGGLAARLLLKFKRGEVNSAINQVLTAKPTPHGEGRHDVIKLFTWALAHVAEPQESSEKLIQIMRPWTVAMNETYGFRAGGGWYTECYKCLLGARAKKPTWDAARAAQQATLKAFDSNKAFPNPEELGESSD